MKIRNLILLAFGLLPFFAAAQNATFDRVRLRQGLTIRSEKADSIIRAVTALSNHTSIPTAKAVWDAIAAIVSASKYQTLRDDGSNMTQQPAANFVSTGTVSFTLTNDPGNLETEVAAAVPTGGITTTEILDGTIVNADISSSANIANSKLANSGVTASSYPSTGGSTVQFAVNSKGIITSATTIPLDDPSATNEGRLGVGAGGTNNALLTSSTSGSTGVTYAGGTAIGISETTNTNGGTITITNTGDTDPANDLTVSDTVRTVSAASTHSKYPTAAAVWNAISGATAGSGDILNGGNTTGATVVIGTNDANALELETNGETRYAISTTGAETSTSTVSNTNSVANTATLVANSTGTAATGFGIRHLYQLETSTTNAQDAAAVETSWSDATHATRKGKIGWWLQNVVAGGLTEHMSLGTSDGGTLTLGNAWATTYSRSLISPGGQFFIITTSGILGLQSSNNSFQSVRIEGTGNSNSVCIGNTAYTSTTLAKTDALTRSTYTAASGSGGYTFLSLENTFNLTSTASGIQRGIQIAPTLTSLAGATYRAIDIAANHASAWGVYQWGASTRNYFAGKIGVGTTTPGTMLAVAGVSPDAAITVQNTTAGTGKAWMLSSFDDGTLSIGHSGIGTAIAVDPTTEGVTLDGPLTLSTLSGTGTQLLGATSGNVATTITVGSGLSLSGGTLSATGGATDLGFTGTSSPVTLTSSTGADVTITAGGINSLSATGTNLTITATEAQTFSNTSDPTSHTVTITNTGGSVQFVEGSGITLTTTGTSGAGVVTIAASGGGGGSPSVETLTEWTDDQDNVSINSATTTLRVSGDSGIRGLTSINASGMADGREFNILNVGTNPVVIQAQHPDGSASNKFDILQDVILAPKSGCRAIYDGTSTAFRVIADAATPQKKFGRNVVAGSITAGDWGEIDLVTSGGTITDFAANSNVPSAFSLNTSTSATGKSYILGAKTVNALFRSGYGYLYYRAVVTIPTLSTGTQHFLSYNGLLSSANSTNEGGGNYVVIQYRHDLNGGRWEGWSASSADIGMVDLGVTVVAGTPYTLEIYLNKQRTEARYYIDGVYRGRRTTLLPDNATIMRPTSGIHKIIGTTSRSVYVHELEHWGVMSN